VATQSLHQLVPCFGILPRSFGVKGYLQVY